MAGFCECGDGLPGFIKGGEFIELPRTTLLLRKVSAPWKYYYYY